MSIKLKSKDRRIAFWVSFVYVILMTTVMFILHINLINVVSFWPIFSGTLGFLGTLGVANYMSTPKETIPKDTDYVT